MYSQQQTETETTLKSFHIIEKLGSGSFASVYKVQRLDDQQYYALKKVKIGEMRQKEKQNALNQVRILASIHHTNIVNYKQAFFDSQSQALCIVMQYADAGDIQKKINKHLSDHTHFTQKQIWKAIIQMAKGLKALHQINIFHRDLKCANVFCTKDGKYKLGDLNVSKVAKKGMAKTQTGTPYYTSPQVWKDRPYDSKCDIWSLGCVAYEMATLRPPFRASNMKELYAKIQRGIFQRIPAFYSQDLFNIISLCLKVNPVSRPSASELLQNSRVKTNMPSEQFYSQNVQQTYKANLLRTIQVPRNLHSLKNALPKSKYQTQRTSQSKERERVQSQPQYISDRRYSRNNSVQLLRKEVPRIMQTPKNNEDANNNNNNQNYKPNQYFRRPVSSGHQQNSNANKQAKSQVIRDDYRYKIPANNNLSVNNGNKNPQIRMSRNNSVDSIKKIDKSIQRNRIQRVNSGKCIIPSQNINYNNIINSNNNNVNNEIKNLDYKVDKIIQKCEKVRSGSSKQLIRQKDRQRDRILSRQKQQKVKNQMQDISNRCKQIQDKVNGLLNNRKKQESNSQKALQLPNIAYRRPKVSIPRVDSRNRLLSAGSINSRQKQKQRQQVNISNNNRSRQKSFQRPVSRQKSYDRINSYQNNLNNLINKINNNNQSEVLNNLSNNSNSNNNKDKDKDKSLERNPSRKRYLYQQQSPRIR